MARIRTIKPEFFTSETLARVPKSARLTFIGLWTYADDNGVAPDNFRLITAALYPLEEDVVGARADVVEELRILERVGVIQRYAVAGKRFLFVKSWDEHQKISHPAKPRYWRPTPSPHNPPGAHPVVSFDSAPETLRQSSGGSPESLPGPENSPMSDERLILEEQNGHFEPSPNEHQKPAGQTTLRKPSGDSPATLRPEQGAGSREQGAGSREEHLLNSAIQPPLLVVVGSEPLAPLTERAPDRFDEFWKAYPRRVGKAKAERTFATKVRNGADPAAVIDAAASLAARCRQLNENPKYIPHPTTWLNRESWTDDLDQSMPLPTTALAVADGPGGYRPSTADQRVAQALAAADQVVAELQARRSS